MILVRETWSGWAHWRTTHVALWWHERASWRCQRVEGECARELLTGESCIPF